MCSPPPAMSAKTRSCQAPPYSEVTVRDRRLAHQVVVAAAVGDQVRDRADLQPVPLGEGDEVGQPRHAAVVVHHLADHARGVEAGEPRDVDRRLGMAGAHQHAAVAGAQREDVARRRDVLRAGARVDGDRDGAGAVMRRDAGGDALARLDRDGEGGLVPRRVRGAISGRPSASSRSPGSARQISPRPWVAMKLIAFGVAICAGMTRSPSFSRSSWSTRMNMRPLRASSMISSIDEIASW